MRAWPYLRWIVVIILASIVGVVVSRVIGGDSVDARLIAIFTILGYLDARIDHAKDRR